MAVAIAVSAGAGGGDFETHVLELLEQRNPDAVPVFREAEQARRAGEPGKAAAGFRRALELAPDFTHALRRLCQCEAELGERDSALVHCRRAVGIERSGENLATLAMVLVQMGAGGTEAEVAEALQLARESVRADPLSVAGQGVLCQVAMLSKEVATLAQCVEQLQRVAPDDFMTHVFAASLAITRSRWTEAREEIERARALGAPAELYADISASIARHEPKSGFALWYWLLSAAAVVAMGLLVVVLIRRARRR